MRVRISHKHGKDIPHWLFHEMLRQTGIDKDEFIRILAEYPLLFHQNLFKPKKIRKLGQSGIISSLPLWGLFALAIKLEDRGPVFYTQKRMGKNGRIFKVYHKVDISF